jgi:hypothetical protein
MGIFAASRPSLAKTVNLDDIFTLSQLADPAPMSTISFITVYIIILYTGVDNKKKTVSPRRTINDRFKELTALSMGGNYSLRVLYRKLY